MQSRPLTQLGLQSLKSVCLHHCRPGLSIALAALLIGATVGILPVTAAENRLPQAEPSCLDAPVVPLEDPDFVVSTESQLRKALSAAKDGDSVLLQPGVYRLSRTLSITTPNLTIQGDSSRCDDIELIGAGMENRDYGGAPHGFWVNAPGVSIRNLAISDFYHHAITFGPKATAPALYNLRLRDAGEQFVKASDFADLGAGVDDGLVEYSVIHYSVAPPTTDHGGGGSGYTNGIDVHGGKRWIIRNNYFGNFHTPDSARHLWNPAILMWNGAADTLVENNRFVDVDRAVAFGLSDRDADHSGGLIRNNMIYYRPDLMNWRRSLGSDAAIVVWNSPGTRVLHNTIVTNDNVRYAIEFRFHTDGGVAANNLSDTSVRRRQGGRHVAQSNAKISGSMQFVQAPIGDLHLRESFRPRYKLELHTEALLDVDGESRENVANLLPGADQIN
jgi:hypothetical protein